MRSESFRQEGGIAKVGVEAGFILALTLWMLAAMAVVAAGVAVWSLEQVREASEANAGLQSRQAMIGTRDTLLYLFATTATNRAGLPMRRMSAERATRLRLDDFGALDKTLTEYDLRLDGRGYQGLGGATFSIQDESGLLSLFWPQPRDIDAALIGFGVAPVRAPVLRDRLLDYIDTDDLNRLQGAEQADYRRSGLSPPSNRRLLLPTELMRVDQWASGDAEILRELIELSTTHYAGAVNMNTMPPNLLPRMVPGCPATCAALVAARNTLPFISALDLAGRLGVILPGDAFTDYRFAPSEDMRLTLSGEQGAVWRIHVKLTPNAGGKAPWRVSAAYPIPRLANDEATRPTGSDLFPDPEIDRP